MTDTTKYNFSFSGISLRTKEMILLAQHDFSGMQLDIIQTFGAGKKKSARSVFDECNKRLNTLTAGQKNLLASADLHTARQMAFLAICKSHAFIRDFTVEVVREKFLIFDYQLTDGEYLSFFRRKAEQHPEIDNLKETSQKSVKMRTFKILEQAGIIDTIRSKQIQMQLLEHQTIQLIKEDHPDWLKIFLFSDSDIKNLIY